MQVKNSTHFCSCFWFCRRKVKGTYKEKSPSAFLKQNQQCMIFNNLFSNLEKQYVRPCDLNLISLNMYDSYHNFISDNLNPLFAFCFLKSRLCVDVKVRFQQVKKYKLSSLCCHSQAEMCGGTHTECRAVRIEMCCGM